MKTNMGATDRIVRIFAAIGFVVLYLTNVVTGVIGIVLLVLAAIFLLTSYFAHCPLYALFGMNTCGVKTTKAH